MDTTRLHLADSVFHILDANLNGGATIYVTVRVYNRVGLWGERSSNGFKIDTTSPDLTQAPKMDPSKGTIHD